MTEDRRALLMALQAGDIVRFNGWIRVVRSVTTSGCEKRGRKRGYWPKRTFSFAILRCSWTSRPYTVYTTSDLGNPKWDISLVARNYKPKQAIEALLQQEIDSNHCAKPLLTCCDIHGIS